jgi:tetratricopeptide (TPR) repeat protein
VSKVSGCFVGIVLIISFPVFSAEPPRIADVEYLFKRASGLYEAGQYDEAIAEYGLLLRQGFESGSLYYNLGNCFLKKAELGKAILNYERARRLIPLEFGLQSNYKYAKSLVIRNQYEPSGRGEMKALDWSFSWISMDGLTILLSILYLLSILILISGIYLPAIRRFSKGVLLLLAIVFLLCGLGLNRKVSLLDREAIIITPKAEAKFQPFDRAPIHFTLEEGTKVQILRMSRNWVKVMLPDKKMGWLRASILELI